MSQQSWTSWSDSLPQGSGIPLPRGGHAHTMPPTPPPVVSTMAPPVVALAAASEEARPIAREPHRPGQGFSAVALAGVVEGLARLGTRAAGRRLALAAGSLAMILFVGCYTGLQVKQFLGAGSEKETIARVEKPSQEDGRAELLNLASHMAGTQPAGEMVSPVAESLFASVRDGLSQPVEQVATQASESWRRGSTELLPEPPIEPAADGETFVSLEAPAPKGVTPAICDSGKCRLPGEEMVHDWETYLGTAIAWQSDLQEARRLARRENKMLFVIGISGNFEDPGFT